MSEPPVHVRPVVPADHPAVLALAPRLVEGVAAWRDPGQVEAAVLGWVSSSLAGRLGFVEEDVRLTLGC